MDVLPDKLESVARTRVLSAGVQKGVRRELDFTPGANVSLVFSDDSGNDRLTITPAVAFTSQATFTQTYSTPATTVNAATAATVVTTASTNITPFGYTQAQADAIPVAINALIADNLNLRQLVNKLIDILQAEGIAS